MAGKSIGNGDQIPALPGSDPMRRTPGRNRTARVKEAVSAEPVPLGGSTLNYLTTPPYPARAVDEAASSPLVGAGALWRMPLSSDYIAIVADVSALSLVQTFFPIDYSIALAGQSQSSFHEDIAIVGDVTAINVGTTFFPVDALYMLQGQSPANYHEHISIGGDVIGLSLAATFDPVDYLNWPTEKLEIVADITAITVSTS